MNRKQDHEDRVEKNKDDNTNLPLTEDKTAFTLNSPPRFELPSRWKISPTFRYYAKIALFAISSEIFSKPSANFA
jgi:hypothetical protein